MLCIRAELFIRLLDTIDNDTIRVNAPLKGFLCLCMCVCLGWCVCVWDVGVCVWFQHFPAAHLDYVSNFLLFTRDTFPCINQSINQSMEEEFHALFRLLVVKQYSIRRTHFTAWRPDSFVGHRYRHRHRDHLGIVAKILRSDCHHYHHTRVVDRPRSCCCSRADLC